MFRGFRNFVIGVWKSFGNICANPVFAFDYIEEERMLAKPVKEN